jgi:hypothetical protein
MIEREFARIRRDYAQGTKNLVRAILLVAQVIR